MCYPFMESECLLLNANSVILSAISWREQINFNEMMMMRSALYYWPTRLVAFLYSASSLKQQSADRHVAPLGHIIMIEPTILCSFSLMLRAWRRSNKYQFYKSLVWPDRGSNPRSTAFEVSMLTITPPMQ